MASNRVRLAPMRDFTGGLNLRADAFQLAKNESPDLLNVDIDPSGGFRQRKGVETFANALPSDALAAWEFATTGGIRQVMVSTATTVQATTGTTWSTAFSRTGPCRAAVFKDRCYVVGPDANPVRWDGVSATALALNYNDNLETPTASGAVGSMPISRCIGAFMGSLWVANTLEGGTRYPNRLRFSHPNFPEDFHSSHFIDVDAGVDGDEIVGLVPFDDRMLVFKKRSIHAVYGSSPENYYVIPISQEVGAISQEAIVSTDLGVYFWSWPEGVMLYDGRNSPRWVFERLHPAVLDGRIPHAYQAQIRLGWGNRRLWAAVPWMGSPTRSRCFVLDPTLGKLGSWVAYDLAAGPFVEWNPPGGNSTLLAGAVGKSRMLRVDQALDYDEMGDGQVPITTRFRTGWIDMGEPALPKRWKRPEFVLKSGSTAEVFVNVYKDYDPTYASRHFRLNTEADDEAIAIVDPITDEGDGWGVAEWGVSLWGRNGSRPGAPIASPRNEMSRGSPLGNSRAVALEFYGPTDLVGNWGVDSITFKIIPRKPRS